MHRTGGVHSRLVTRRLLVVAVLVLSALPVLTVGAAPASAHEPVPTNYCTNAPDRVSGFYDFRHACAHHDACYALHSSTRSGCDSTFLSEMRVACRADNAWYNPARLACYDVANLYYGAVRVRGGPYYSSGSTSTPMR